MKVPDTERRVFLLLGQSNMAGRGRIGSVPPIEDPLIFMYRAGTWAPAIEPLHDDKPGWAGIGLGMSFASAVAAASNRPVGLIPRAVGGTTLAEWMPGSPLYLRAVDSARSAVGGGPLEGILWHQGENDCAASADAQSYEERLVALMGALCGDLGARPAILLGELGGYLAPRDDCPFFSLVNEALHRAARRLPRCLCVGAAGLADNGDALHFDAPSLREFGRRYAEAYLSLQGPA